MPANGRRDLIRRLKVNINEENDPDSSYNSNPPVGETPFERTFGYDASM